MRRYMNMKTAIPGLLLSTMLGSLWAGTDAVAAGEAMEVAARRISYADLDLSSDAGAAVLYARIRLAARQVCVVTSGAWRFGALESARGCIEAAVTRAVADVHAPTLTGYYLVKTGQSIHLAEK